MTNRNATSLILPPPPSARHGRHTDTHTNIKMRICARTRCRAHALIADGSIYGIMRPTAPAAQPSPRAFSRRCIILLHCYIPNSNLPSIYHRPTLVFISFFFFNTRGKLVLYSTTDFPFATRVCTQNRFFNRPDAFIFVQKKKIYAQSVFDIF